MIMIVFSISIAQYCEKTCTLIFQHKANCFEMLFILFKEEERGREREGERGRERERERQGRRERGRERQGHRERERERERVIVELYCNRTSRGNKSCLRRYIDKQSTCFFKKNFSKNIYLRNCFQILLISVSSNQSATGSVVLTGFEIMQPLFKVIAMQ